MGRAGARRRRRRRIGGCVVALRLRQDRRNVDCLLSPPLQPFAPLASRSVAFRLRRRFVVGEVEQLFEPLFRG
jgi:hypothetical protein